MWILSTSSISINSLEDSTGEVNEDKFDSVLPERSAAEILEDRNNIHSVHAGAKILKTVPDRKLYPFLLNAFRYRLIKKSAYNIYLMQFLGLTFLMCLLS
jgi:hypothetical protein